MSNAVISEKLRYILDDHINTDVMTPGKYLTSYEPEYLGSICLIDLDPGFREKVAGGAIVTAGVNFGCGSSRETAPIALKAAGARVIIAKEFARIFYRNALNIGLPCIVCAEAVDSCALGDELEVALQTGTIVNKTTGKTFQGEGIPEELLEQFRAGGLIPYLKLTLGKKEG